MNYIIPTLPSWAHKLVGGTAVTSSCHHFPQVCCREVDSLETYPCKILTPFRH